MVKGLYGYLSSIKIPHGQYILDVKSIHKLHFPKLWSHISEKDIWGKYGMEVTHKNL